MIPPSEPIYSAGLRPRLRAIFRAGVRGVIRSSGRGARGPVDQGEPLGESCGRPATFRGASAFTRPAVPSAAGPPECESFLVEILIITRDIRLLR